MKIVFRFWKKKFGSSLGNKGGALLHAMVISFVGAVLVGALAQYFGTLAKTVFKNNDIGALRTVLNSTMDYTMNGVRNRWCFSETWTMKAQCVLSDPNNVERLLLSDQALTAIESSMPAADYGGSISKVRTKSISSSVRFADITPEHPLYYAVKGIKDIGKDFTFNFVITRLDNGIQKGREVALQIEVELVLGANSLIKITNDSVRLISTVMVFPRELNTNALMIANNLFLDRPDPGLTGAGKGDVYISPSFDSGLPGIQFHSPVFVNGNIYVPNSDAPGFTPVTFGDKVIIGGGLILEGVGGSAVYSRPKTAGGSEDRYYAQTKRFGGFLKGILLDPGADEGLRVFAGLSTGKTPPNSSDLCILRNLAKADLAITRDSQLYIKHKKADAEEAAATAVSNVTSKYSFVANLGSIDTFYKQSISGSNQYKAASAASLMPQVTYSGDADELRPIMRVTVALNGMVQNFGSFVVADLSRQAVMNIPMNPADPSAIMRITTTPYFTGGRPQSHAVNLDVELINQERFAMNPYPVKMTGSSVTTSAEPSIQVNIEAFDVGYVTEGGTNISSGRIKGSNGIPVQDCPVGSDDYMNDTKVFNGVTYRCYSQFAWHPVMGRYKNNGFSFKRNIGEPSKRFVLSRNDSVGGVSGGYFTCPALDETCPAPYDSVAEPQEIDFVAFDAACSVPPSGTDVFPSFQASDWNKTSFTVQTRKSWGFTEQGTELEPGYNPGNLIIDEESARFDGVVKPTFMIASIYNTCIIKSTANFVTGFFVCDHLKIESRSEPLRIVGTFIVGRMSVDEDALKAGIRWSNIYYPTAVMELRAAGVLKASGVEPCDIPADPLWNPYPSIARAQHVYKCNPISLRNKADPFTWTLVDPDCGLIGSKQQCKYRVLRYELVELKRQEIF